MLRKSFTDAIADYNKKARLRGVKGISERQLGTIAESVSKESRRRLAAKRAHDLEKKRHEENLAFQKERFEERKKQREEEIRARRMGAVGSGFGALAGGLMAAGTSIGGPAGAAIGAGIGGLLGDCIIITACTSPGSYEVMVARRYRDKYMSSYQLGGYYALCEVVVPLINKYPALKRFTKKVLVDRLVDYGEWILEFKPKRELITSKFVTRCFLRLCTTLGFRVNIRRYLAAHRS